MKNNLKIALVTGGLQFGGSTTFLLNLVSGLKAFNVSCAIFSLTRVNPLDSEFAALGVPVHTFDEKRLIFEDRLSAIYRGISDFNPCAVIANIGGDAYEVLRYMPSGIARIGMVHDLAMNPRHLISLYRDFLDGVVTVNSHLLGEVQSAAPELNCRYIPHGISLEGKPLPRNPNPDRPLKIIFFGRLVEGKGTRIFPSIVSELHKRSIPFQWTMHGQGPDEHYLREQLAKEIATGEVTVSSQLAGRSELSPLIREHDVFIMASDVEGGPLTLLESMSLGLVPICNDIPCLAQEVLNPENGFRIPRDPQHYAESLAILHENRALLERMSAAARKTISAAYSIESMAKRYLEFTASLASPQSHTTWPASVQPAPIRGISPTAQLLQRFRLLRPVRRIFKSMKSARPR